MGQAKTKVLPGEEQHDHGGNDDQPGDISGSTPHRTPSISQARDEDRL
jgi:hypothetical protein